LTEASESLQEVMTEIKSGEGFLHSVIYEKTDEGLFSNLASSAQALAETAKLVSDIAAEVKSGDGLMHQLLYGESIDLAAKINQVMQNLNDSATAIKRASQALAHGEGTIGALLVDSQLYDNLVEVTDGAKRSYLLRRAIRSSLKK